MEYTYVNGQREQADTDRGTWHYGYNSRGEVTSGTKKITNTAVPGYAFEYAFDGIGNRELATTNGIEDVYTPNSLNQYEQRTVPAYFQVRGMAKPIPVMPPATPPEPEGVAVKLEGLQSPYTGADFGPANYFGLALPVPTPGNQNNALWKGITLEAWASDATNEYKVTETLNAFLPKSPEDCDYDFDGNLTKDGRWTYEWDGENRLVSMTARTADFPGQTLPSGMDVGKLVFKYDWMGRRMIKLVYAQNGTTLLRWTGFIYDDWQLMGDVERHVSAGANTRVISRAYSWGPDLSGHVQGAGGVGGLLSVQLTNTDIATGFITSETWVPAYDGNGNVVAYLNAANGEITQEEEYGPFGESLRPKGNALLRCPTGWSTKYTDEETGLIYYGYRYYSPQTGRWISRDPIGEHGGINLSAFCLNSPIRNLDVLGLEPISDEIFGILIHRAVTSTWRGRGESRVFPQNANGIVSGEDSYLFRSSESQIMYQKTKTMREGFYADVLREKMKDKELSSGWKKFDFLPKRALTKDQLFRIRSEGGFDIGFWLNEAESLFVIGDFEARCAGQTLEMKNRWIVWNWYDTIDTNPSIHDPIIKHILENLWRGVEGTSHNTVQYKIRLQWLDETKNVISFPFKTND